MFWSCVEMEVSVLQQRLEEEDDDGSPGCRGKAPQALCSPEFGRFGAQEPGRLIRLCSGVAECHADTSDTSVQ